MRFSIIVPIYNIEKYLNKCINSVLAQSFYDFELILVDDGSTDSSAKICDKYAKQDSRITVIHKNNGGLVSARKAGVNIARGEYIIHVDGDDWIDSSTLMSINTELCKKSVDIVCFGFIEVSNNERIKKRINLKAGIYNREDMKREIFPYLIEDAKGRYFIHSAWGKAYRRELVKKYQRLVDDDICMSEDAALTVPCINAASTISIMSNCLYYYNCLNNDSITRKRKALTWEWPNQLKRHYMQFDFLKVPFFLKQIYRNEVHNLFNVAVSQYNKEESYSEISKSIKEKLNDPIYAVSIREARFSSLMGIVCELAIRYRICLVFYFRWFWKYR